MHSLGSYTTSRRIATTTAGFAVRNKGSWGLWLAQGEGLFPAFGEA